jgi:hypothetical protein
MFLWEVVHTASQAADGSLPGQPVEGNVHGLPAADIHEISWDEHGTSSTTTNGRNYLRINSLW